MACAVVAVRMSSYHPRHANAPSWKFSCNSTVPPPGPPPPPPPLPPPELIVAVVVPEAVLDNPPKTAFWLRVPRNATSWTVYVVALVRPSTEQVRLAPIVVPATGVAQVPRLTLGTPPHGMFAPAMERTS